MTTDERIYGETFEDLFSIIVELEFIPSARGKVQITSHELPGSRLAPLTRALMRAEAEVLLEMAELGDVTHYGDGHGDERHGEAFARVFRAMGRAEGERFRSR